MFLLHPDDEKPTRRINDQFISQYVHGGINIKNDNDLSIAFVFRVISADREYDAITSKLIPNVSDLKKGDSISSEKSKSLRTALDRFRCEKMELYFKKFQNFVQRKLTDWNW